MTVAPQGHDRSGEGSADFAQVLDAARAGSPEALGQLWGRYSPGVLSFARSRGAGEPDEVTSDCFLAVFARLGDFRGNESEFRAFVYTVAHRRVVDDFRRRSGGLPVRPFLEDEEGPAEPSAEDIAVRRLSTAGAWQLLGSLTSDQRDVLALRIFGDLTLEEVATVLDKRTGAVKALQRRGLESLRRMLGDGTSLRYDETEEGT